MMFQEAATQTHAYRVALQKLLDTPSPATWLTKDDLAAAKIVVIESLKILDLLADRIGSNIDELNSYTDEFLSLLDTANTQAEKKIELLR